MLGLGVGIINYNTKQVQVDKFRYWSTVRPATMDIYMMSPLLSRESKFLLF